MPSETASVASSASGVTSAGHAPGSACSRSRATLSPIHHAPATQAPVTAPIAAATTIVPTGRTGVLYTTRPPGQSLTVRMRDQ